MSLLAGLNASAPTFNFRPKKRMLTEGGSSPVWHWYDLLKLTVVVDGVKYFHGLSHNDRRAGVTTALV